MANITIDDGARTEIQQALNLGLEVTVHQSPLTVNGWQGSGYAILDAEYGVGAYQISGGVSGGFTALLNFSLVLAAVVGAPVTSIIVGGAIISVILSAASFLDSVNGCANQGISDLGLAIFAVFILAAFKREYAIATAVGGVLVGEGFPNVEAALCKLL